MSEDIDFYTVTLAKVYANQGHLEKASRIYRHLLEQEPHRQDLMDALADIDKRRFAGGKQVHDDLVSLFSKWMELLLGGNRLRRLRKIQRQISDRSD